jgi:pimeloyl-ACP methyl ester carboxylesterase
VRIGSRRSADAVATLRDLAQDVVDVLDHLGIAHAWIGGHAFGGSIARIVALDHHDRVNGVVLFGVEGPEGIPLDASEVPADARDPQAATLHAMVDGALPPLAEGLPVLVIQGTADAVTPPSHGDALQASAPGLVSVVRVDGGGHLFPATHVVATSWAIEDYLDWD